MKTNTNGRTEAAFRSLATLLGAFALASAALAQQSDGEYAAPSDDIGQTVARVAYFSGDVSYSRGDDPDTWQPASLNFPMTLGDHLYTAANSRLELQIEGGSVYLAPETDIAALNLTDDVKQFSLAMGSASFRVPFIDSNDTFEVDTPNAAVTFDRPGAYRIDVDRDGNSRVIVERGHAYVAASGGEVPLEAGRMMSIDGIDAPVYDVSSRPQGDSWDQWVVTRSRRYPDGGDRQYVSANISGGDELSQYGRWSEVQGYGTVWSPSDVSVDWQPYRAGRWIWQDPWGWSWVSNEPWGWAPYHYGRWVNAQSHWYWVPVGPDVRTVRYAPALVAFVGGPGFSLSVSVGGGASDDRGGFVGWFPLAPRDPYVPWWGARARTSSATNITNVTNVNYVNRNYVTVVNHDTFVSGAPVGRNVIRDERTVREISSAPVVRGRLPVEPIVASIRVSTESARQAPRPPPAATDRSVVTRRAPAPAPALFRVNERAIHDQRGAPQASPDVARVPPDGRPIRPTRSVIVPEGRIALTPKHAPGSTPPPAPVPVTPEAPPGRPRDPQNVERRQAVTPPERDNRQAQQAEAAGRQKQQQADAVGTQQEQQRSSAAEAQRQQRQTAATTQKQENDAAAAASQRKSQVDAAQRQAQPGANAPSAAERQKVRNDRKKLRGKDKTQPVDETKPPADTGKH